MIYYKIVMGQYSPAYYFQLYVPVCKGEDSSCALVWSGCTHVSVSAKWAANLASVTSCAKKPKKLNKLNTFLHIICLFLKGSYVP